MISIIHIRWQQHIVTVSNYVHFQSDVCGADWIPGLDWNVFCSTFTSILVVPCANINYEIYDECIIVSAPIVINSSMWTLSDIPDRWELRSTRVSIARYFDPSDGRTNVAFKSTRDTSTVSSDASAHLSMRESNSLTSSHEEDIRIIQWSKFIRNIRQIDPYLEPHARPNVYVTRSRLLEDLLYWGISVRNIITY